MCASVFTSQEKDVATHGRYIRLIEGVPVFARHSTQTNEHEVWKNHGGTFARVLGTAPLAPDGSCCESACAVEEAEKVKIKTQSVKLRKSSRLAGISLF
ncbi:MAG: hypothetical protein U9Q07_10795 [Planctomycetota bacterium]|nr:hypothetical protein [Planctomycetota bacterium]